MDFAVPADHRIKLKESEKKYKYVDIARELKKKNNKEKQTMKHELCLLHLEQSLNALYKGRRTWK